jgi:outer membrane protein, heavy metal efflux system
MSAVFLVATLCPAHAAQADATVVNGTAPNGAITLAQAIDLMRARDPNIAVAQTAVDQAQADRITAGERPNATLSYSTSKINPAGHNGPGSIWDKSYDTIVNIGQPLERGAKRAHRLAMAGSNLDAAHFDLADTLRSERLAVAQSFWELKRAEEKYANAQTLADIESRSLRASEARLKLGDMPKLDVERMRIGVAQAENAVDAAKGSLQLAQIELASRIETGVAQPNLSTADAWPRAVAASDLIADAQRRTGSPDNGAALTERPDVLAAQQRVDAADAALDLAHAQTTRDVTVSGQYERNPTPFGHTLLGVGLSVPLFTGNHFDGEIARAYADLDAVKANLARVRIAAIAEMRRAAAGVAAAAQRAQRYDGDLIDRSLRTEQALEVAYAHGGVGLADLLDARRELKSVQDDAADAHADYAEAIAALEAAIPRAPASTRP